MSDWPSHTLEMVTVLKQFRPGSFPAPWTWDDEDRWLRDRPYQRALEAHIRQLGRVEQPVLLGDDGRIWDGHHRIVAARRLQLAMIPAECFCDEGLPCKAAALAVA